MLLFYLCLCYMSIHKTIVDPYPQRGLMCVQYVCRKAHTLFGGACAFIGNIH